MKKKLVFQSFLLLVGTAFAWYNTIKNFLNFYRIEGTIFKIADCQIPNPVTEACFYGAVAFLVGLIWSIIIIKKQGSTSITKPQRYLWWFISAGAIFAWYNVVQEFVAYYNSGPGQALGCSANPITNPFLTPCFTGASIFLVTAILSGFTYSKLAKL